MFNVQRCRLYSIVGPKVERDGDRGRPRLDILEDVLGPVSRKSRNFSGLFRVTEFSLYLENEGVSRHETLQLFLFPLQHMKRTALQNKQIVILRMAFRARKVILTFEKRAPGLREERGLWIRFFESCLR